MTNEEKYEEVFGFKPAYMCPSRYCSSCPIGILTCTSIDTTYADWWRSEYKEVKNNEQKNDKFGGNRQS